MYLFYMCCAFVMMVIYLQNTVAISKPSQLGRSSYGEIAECRGVPYQTAIYIDKTRTTYFCSGTLITNKFVLTAAHCLYDAVSADLIFGANNLKRITEKQIRMVSNKFRIHEAWDPRLEINNIALIELPRPVVLSKRIAIIKLPNKFEWRRNYIGDNAQISGWGAKSNQENIKTDILRVLNVHVVSPQQCANYHVRPTQICAVGENGGSPCYGDDGGPLVIQENGSVTQVGIILYNIISVYCTQGHPNIFTRITSYIDWIKNNSDYF